MLYGLSPAGYAMTNLALAFAIVSGIIWLGTSLRLPPVAAVFGAGLWILNFHGISTALLWISGRTSLLATVFAVFAAVALVRGRPLWAGWLTLASLMSKEEPIMLPVSLRCGCGSTGGRLAAIARMTWPSFAALARLSRAPAQDRRVHAGHGSLVLSPQRLARGSPAERDFLSRSLDDLHGRGAPARGAGVCPGSNQSHWTPSGRRP